MIFRNESDNITKYLCYYNSELKSGGKNLKQNEVIKLISEKTGVEQADVQKVVKALLDEITESLAKGEEVQLWGFGRFERRTYKARKCYNPLKDKIIDLKGSYSPVFKAGTKMREYINK